MRTSADNRRLNELQHPLLWAHCSLAALQYQSCSRSRTYAYHGITAASPKATFILRVQMLAHLQARQSSDIHFTCERTLVSAGSGHCEEFTPTTAFTGTKTHHS
ncbi:hypothetical protein PhaeoP73_02464 [Phaeobacter gallaeciensis]|nr:hypothetical protein PhaeoP73_02464 [Phaeobacter gallaeciensis]